MPSEERSTRVKDWSDGWCKDCKKSGDCPLESYEISKGGPNSALLRCTTHFQPKARDKAKGEK